MEGHHDRSLPGRRAAGILTGVLLAVARISGETAPLLFTALNNQFWSTDMNEPMANLPVVIFQFAMSPYDDWQHLAWAGALLITVDYPGLNIFARVACTEVLPSDDHGKRHVADSTESAGTGHPG